MGMINSIDEILSGAVNVGITGHVRPDGDCVGSTLGLYNYILKNYPNIKATVYLEPFEKHFMYINGSDKVVNKIETPVEHDLFVVLDCGDLNRVAEFVRPLIEGAERTVCIDHHMCNLAFADVNHVLPKISSTCEVLYELFDGDKVDKTVA
jgi:phosphoesterase RecJ-like protein